jgi:ferredoxin-type protein NapF
VKTQSINRHQLLRGQFAGAGAIRPPWSVNELAFTENCTRCFECARVCHLHLIVKGSGGYPEVSFNRQGCDFCEACVRACPEDVISINAHNQQNAWNHKATINQDCFSSRGIVCRSCAEICESRAITFKPGISGVAQVTLNFAACNGCGECVHVCPADAINISEIGKSHE